MTSRAWDHYRWNPAHWPAGLRASIPVTLPTAAVGASFGVLATPLLGAGPTVVMSLLVWSGTAQFAALSTVGAGGAAGLAASTALLANTRFLPMGFAIAPSMRGGWLRRLLTGALLADASFVIGNRGAGRFDITAIAWAAPVQYLSWSLGTLLGVAGSGVIDDPAVWGLDVLFPVFYLSVLLPELFPGQGSAGIGRGRRRVTGAAVKPVLAAGLGALIALALTPIAPPGVPVLAAAAAALTGLRSPHPPGER